MNKPESLSSILDSALENIDPAKPYIVVGDKILSYGEFRDRIFKLISLFEMWNLKPQDRVGIISTDSAMVAVIIIACIRSGLAVVNFNPEMTSREQSKTLEITALNRLIIDRDLVDASAIPGTIDHTVIEAEASKNGLMDRLLGRKPALENAGGLMAEIQTAPLSPVPAPIADDQIGLMLLTSGTTSQEPKVVQLTHANLAAQLTSFSKVYDFDAQSRILNPLPMHFTDGILHGPLIALVSGATLFRPKKFQIQELGELLDSVYRNRITHFSTVPAILSMIVRLGSEYKDAFSTPDFRYIRSSGDRLPEKLWKSVQTMFGVRVVNTYGLSETVCESIYCGPAEETFRIGTIGKPIDCEIRILHEDGSVAPEGSGELLICGPHIMRGYLNRPDLTSEAVDDDGWFHTGDLASIDLDGFVTITGRKKEIIISGGINVQPREITDAMLEHDEVAEAHVVGLPDSVWGESIACAIVLKDRSSEICEQKLLAHAHERLAPGKVPQIVKLVDQLPRNPAGKILIADLKNLLSSSGMDSNKMSEGSGEDRIYSVAARVFSCQAADLDIGSEPQNTLGWDSFAHLTLVNEIEKEFDLQMSARDILRITTLGRLTDIVIQKQT